MSLLAVGLMSGTSADGISAVLAKFQGKKFSLLGTHAKPYPRHTVEKIRCGPELTAKELSELNFDIGELFAKAALELLKKCRKNSRNIACIGSHGQTIYHGPHDKIPNTLQIGDPSIIAERTGITTIAHFRERDLAAGGEGAPLIPFFDHYFFGDGPIRAFQNIGGIGNVTVVGGRRPPLAFDTGPGNALMDAAVRLISKGRQDYDENGARARRGTVLGNILVRMLQHDFLKRNPPKSTGLEVFNLDFLRRYFGSRLNKKPNDVLATLNLFTAMTIHGSFRRFILKSYAVKEIIVSGGGVYNKMLMENLRRLFSPISVQSIAKFGISPQIKEPLAFAFFGLRRLQGRINHWPVGTGAKKALSLGCIVPGE